MWCAGIIDATPTDIPFVLFETAFRDEANLPKKHHGHNRHTSATRTACIIAVAKVYDGKEPDYGRAAQEYASLPKELCHDQLPRDSKPVLKRAWEAFMQHGDLKDKPRPGRPTKISKEHALEASELLKAGRMLVHKHKGVTMNLIVYFTTVAEAIRVLPRLKEIVDQYQVTPHQLYEAMKREDKNLKHRSLVTKPAFDDKDKKKRYTWCRDAVVKLGKTVPERMAALDPYVQCDEARLTYSVKGKYTQKVYIDKRTTLLHDFVELPKIAGQEEATVHIFICVSPHPRFADKNGLVYWEFTTGTTNIRRKINLLGQTPEEAFGYLVGELSRSVCYHTYQQGVNPAGPVLHTEHTRAALRVSYKWS